MVTTSSSICPHVFFITRVQQHERQLACSFNRRAWRRSPDSKGWVSNFLAPPTKPSLQSRNLRMAVRPGDLVCVPKNMVSKRRHDALLEHGTARRHALKAQRRLDWILRRHVRPSWIFLSYQFVQDSRPLEELSARPINLQLYLQSPREKMEARGKRFEAIPSGLGEYNRYHKIYEHAGTG
jgi:hypothetical protein